VYEKIREHASALIPASYEYIWKKCNKKEVLYKTVHAALLEFSDRFGKDFEAPDEFYLEQMRIASERVLPSIMEAGFLCAD